MSQKCIIEDIQSINLVCQINLEAECSEQILNMIPNKKHSKIKESIESIEQFKDELSKHFTWGEIHQLLLNSNLKNESFSKKQLIGDEKNALKMENGLKIQQGDQMEKKKILCIFCHTYYSSSKSLRVHIRRFHPSQLRNSLQAKQVANCLFCHQTFTLGCGYQVHLRKKHLQQVKKLRIKQISQISQQNQDYDQIIQIQNLLQCQICNKFCSSIKCLIKHLNRCHKTLLHPMNTQQKLSPYYDFIKRSKRQYTLFLAQKLKKYQHRTQKNINQKNKHPPKQALKITESDLPVIDKIIQAGVYYTPAKPVLKRSKPLKPLINPSPIVQEQQQQSKETCEQIQIKQLSLKQQQVQLEVRCQLQKGFLESYCPRNPSQYAFLELLRKMKQEKSEAMQMQLVKQTFLDMFGLLSQLYEDNGKNKQIRDRQSRQVSDGQKDNVREEWRMKLQCIKRDWQQGHQRSLCMNGNSHSIRSRSKSI